MLGRAALAIVVVVGACVATAAPLSAKGGPEIDERVFVRTTDEGITIRAHTGEYPPEYGLVNTSSCTGPGCAPPRCQIQGGLVIGLSNTNAVSEGWADLYRPGDDPLEVIMASGFGSMFDEPAAWVAVQTGPDVARVRASFAGGDQDQMRPRDGLAVLASPLLGGRALTAESYGPEGTLVAYDDGGEVVDRARFGPGELTSPPEGCLGGLDYEFPDPKGPPPADEEQAGLQVTAAVLGTYTPSDGALAGLAHVEDGASLAEVTEVAAERYPQYREKIAARVDEVRFIDEDEAAVRFELTVDGATLVPGGVGRVKLIDGQWLLSRDSFCRLLVYGGVYCPEPSKGTAE